MLILLLISFPSAIMKSFPSLLVWVLTTTVIMTLTTTVAATVLFDNLLTANAQPQQLNTSQSVTQQQEGVATIHQGIITSSQNPLPGLEEEQRATILPFRQDGSIYTGVLTFTATEPVDVVILNMQTLNETERSILNATEDAEFGTLPASQLDDQTSLVITSITPTYGDSPSPSASIPFAGNALWLLTPDGTPFAASYAVSAEVLPSEIMNNMSSPVETTDTVTLEDGEEVDVADTEDTDTENTAAATDIEGGTEEEAANDAGDNEEVTVRIRQGASELTNDAYTPNPVEVNVGDTVTWINDDLTTHTATSGSSSSGSTGMFGGTDDSPEIMGAAGDTQSFTFDEAGQFEYYCTLHPNMVGTVVVTEG